MSAHPVLRALCRARRRARWPCRPGRPPRPGRPLPGCGVSRPPRCLLVGVAQHPDGVEPGRDQEPLELGHVVRCLARKPTIDVQSGPGPRSERRMRSRSQRNTSGPPERRMPRRTVRLSVLRTRGSKSGQAAESSRWPAPATAHLPPAAGTRPGPAPRRPPRRARAAVAPGAQVSAEDYLPYDGRASLTSTSSRTPCRRASAASTSASSGGRDSERAPRNVSGSRRRCSSSARPDAS